MKISTLGPEAAVGHLSVHAIRTASVTVKKGTILSAEDAGQLREAGIEHAIARYRGYGCHPKDHSVLYLSPRG